jgi:hypothetical protein
MRRLDYGRFFPLFVRSVMSNKIGLGGAQDKPGSFRGTEVNLR